MSSRRFNANKDIKSNRIILVDSDGKKVGEFLRDDALELARTRELDLVQVAEAEGKAICKIFDFKKFLYDKKKAEKENRKKSKPTKTKEISMKVQSDLDYMKIKSAQARKFLKKGMKVRFSVSYRGRQESHLGLVRDKCDKFRELIGEDLFEIEQEPSFSGRQMTMLMSPKK